MSRKARIGRIGILLGVGLSGALLAAAPSAAFADTAGAKKLVPGDKICVQQYANYQVRGDGTASRSGALFTIEYKGLVRTNSNTATTAGWAAELRTSYGTFPGAGYYQVCAYNFQNTNTDATVRIRTDREF